VAGFNRPNEMQQWTGTQTCQQRRVGVGRAKRGIFRKSGSHRILRWREPDSNRQPPLGPERIWLQTVWSSGLRNKAF
jgi:hypothetical protein